MGSIEKRAKVVSFGCQMNERDSETIAGLLAASGYCMCGDDDKLSPDLVIFVTCCVRENAENRALGNLGDMKRLKEANPQMIIGIAGCMVQQEGIREMIAQRMPWVDLVFGTHNIHRLPELLARVEMGERVVEVLPDSEGVQEGLPAIRAYRHKAFVNITYGCDNFCSYCIVPYVRGRERSRGVDDVLYEVCGLVDKGCREVTLLGQNVNAYGRGLPPSPDGRVPGFADLLRAVNSVDGLNRIRFTTSHPRDFTQEMIDACAESERVCRHLHLPLQAGSDRVLSEMNRGYTLGVYLDLLQAIRKKMPDASITTDLMVGFPGETEADFQCTLDAVRSARFDAAFTFIYSPREGTVAAEMPDQIDDAVKTDRIQRLIQVVNETAAGVNTSTVGSVQEVMVEGPSERDPEVMAGRTRSNKMVHWQANRPLEPGDIIYVKITDARTWTLRGESV